MGARRRGLTVIEVLVALAVFAINLLGWFGAMQLIALLLQRTAQLLASLDGLDVAVVCPLALLVAPPLRHDDEPPARWRWRSRAGVTLVELLVALLLAGVVFALVTGAFGSTARFTRSAQAAGEALSLRLAVPTLLQQALEVAGRGVQGGCALALDGGGGRIALRHTIGGGAEVVDEVFAGVDGGGRPALYLRRVPHPRQPWLEDVTGFRVLELQHDGDGRIGALRLAVEHPALEPALEVHVPLPHRPCLEAGP